MDDTVGPLSPKDCTYRIYRDLRFSKDKTPYKTHMGLYINQGGKKSGYSGYYFHVGAKSYGNMVAIGDIWCPPEVLKVIREDIQLGGGDFRMLPTISSKPSACTMRRTTGSSHRRTSPGG